MTDSPVLRQALDALPQLMWVAAADGTLEYLNRRCAEYSGLPIDDLLGWDWGWVVHPADLPDTMRVWSASIRDGTSHEVEHRFRGRDGEYRWFLTRAEPVRDGTGRVVRWFGTCTDIDDAKRAGDRARASQMLFRALVERNHDGLAVVGADGTVRYANPAAAQMLDFPSDELTGSDLWGSVCPADRAEMRVWLDRVLGTPGQRFSATVRFTQRSGAVRWLEVLATNLLPDPNIRAVSVLLRELEGG